MKHHLTIRFEEENEPSNDDREITNCVFELTSDVSDVNAHHWFGLFERVMLAAGYCEASVMAAACALAFNDTRPEDVMRRLATEYDLGELDQGTPSSNPA